MKRIINDAHKTKLTVSLTLAFFLLLLYAGILHPMLRSALKKPPPYEEIHINDPMGITRRLYRSFRSGDIVDFYFWSQINILILERLAKKGLREHQSAQLARGYYLRGIAEEIQNNLDNAINDYNKAVDISDHCSLNYSCACVFYLARARCYHQTGDLLKSAEDYSAAVVRYFDTAKHFNNSRQFLEGLSASNGEISLPPVFTDHENLICFLKSQHSAVSASGESSIAKAIDILVCCDSLTTPSAPVQRLADEQKTQAETAEPEIK